MFKRSFVVCTAVVFCILLGPRNTYAGNEPFGLSLADSPAWHTELKERYRSGIYADELKRIAQVVRSLEGLALLGWTNQLVQMSPLIASDNQCAEKEVAKCEALRLVDPTLECRVVVGCSRKGCDPGHAMAAVRWGEAWRMLDNQHITYRFFTPTDEEVSRGRGVYLFRPRGVYK